MVEEIAGRRGSVRLLLGVERAREQRGGDTRRLIGPALALVNLILLAYAERFLKRESGALFPVLSAEIVLLLYLSLSHMLSSGKLVLERTAHFPLRPVDRFQYLLAGTFRSMPVLLWSAGLLLAFLILHRSSPWTAAGAGGLLLLLILSSEGWSVLLFLILRRQRANVEWTLASPFLALFPAYIVAGGIAGLAAGSWTEPASAAAVLLCLIALAVIAARKVC